MIDRRVILACVLIIGANLFLLMAGIIWAVCMGKALDAGITALAGSALGYIGGILTKNPHPHPEPDKAAAKKPAPVKPQP